MGRSAPRVGITFQCLPRFKEDQVKGSITFLPLCLCLCVSAVSMLSLLLVFPMVSVSFLAAGIFGGEHVRLCPYFCWCHVPLPSHATVFGFQCGLKTRGSRNFPGLWCHIRTVEGSSLCVLSSYQVLRPLLHAGGHCWMTQPLLIETF